MKKNKIHLIQFLPYFPPHKGGLETVAEELGEQRCKHELGSCINIVTDIDQDSVEMDGSNMIMYDGQIIGYIKNNVENIIIPSREIIDGFPMYKIWTKQYNLAIKYLKQKNIQSDEEQYRVVTHTRFFLTSLIGGLFAKRNNIRWVHIEHGSDYVKLSSRWKTKIAYLYDRVIGKYVFRTADTMLTISKACARFVQEKFINRDIGVFYRGMSIELPHMVKTGDVVIVFIGRLVALKGVADLIDAYKESGLSNQLIIFGDGVERASLEKQAMGYNIVFLGAQSREYVIDYLVTHRCVVVNPSYQEGLPTTVIEGLITGNVVIASDVGGTAEISYQDDLILFESGNRNELIKKLLFMQKKYEKLQGNSREEVQKRFSWVNNILDIYGCIK